MGGRLLIVNPRTARVTDDVERRVASAFPDHERIDFRDHAAAIERLAGPSRVVVCGGDRSRSWSSCWRDGGGRDQPPLSIRKALLSARLSG